ncbi:MAG: hypothetical protein V2I27_03675 [Erythrobacter sp.]|jgi:hypothetical protein|nr:hypothetical protein [Erythrobacter sp.]
MTDPANTPAIGPDAESGAVTYYYRNPIGGSVRLGDCTASWTLEAVTFRFLTPDQLPADYYLRTSLQNTMRDEHGNPPSMGVLSMLDLEAGLREAMAREMDAAWDAVFEGQ